MVSKHLSVRIGYLLVLGVFCTAVSGTAASTVSAQLTPATRRVNIPYAGSSVDWAQTAIFWFGQNELGLPGKNYIDVRMAYTSSALRVHVTVIDYYLWYKVNPVPGDDLTQYDAVALYLDTGYNQNNTPQPDDYFFLTGTQNGTAYQRQARGNGSGWNNSWSGSWSHTASMQWSCNPGPNDNGCTIDFGWVATFTIPWSTLAVSGPPAAETLWGLGVRLYDRDAESSAGLLSPEHWPETFAANCPASWGELHFGYGSYEPPQAIVQGTTVIRASSSQDNTVVDAWLGGGGTCSGGHEGGSELNHGDDVYLFVGAETSPTNFPCFSKSYLRFSLDDVPRDKVILSAILTLHQWSNAGSPGEAEPSWVHLFAINDLWDEMTIHWNNAPLARENVAATWLYPITGDDGNWPGVARQWDATSLVAEAYAANGPVDMAIYGSDTEMHSNKYLTSSEQGDWNVASRPVLTVVWGQPVAQVSKQVSPLFVEQGQLATFTLSLLGSGRQLVLTDNLPAEIGVPGTINVIGGPSATYDPGMHRITWSGAPAAGQPVTIVFSAPIRIDGPCTVANTAVLEEVGEGTSSDSAVLLVDPIQVWLPIVLK